MRDISSYISLPEGWVDIIILLIKATKEFYEFTEIQLSLWGCKYHQLFLGKPAGDYYIDDKGINDNDFFDTTLG